MKKIFSVVLFAVMFFAVSACAEVIEFPSLKSTIDVAEGWEYSDDEAGTATLIAPDKSASITISRVSAEGLTADVWAKELSKTHNGTAPVKEGGNWTYSFNGGKTNVMVAMSPDGKEVAIFAVTGENPDVAGMLDSITDK